MKWERTGKTVTVYLEGELDHCNAVRIRRLLDTLIGDGDVKNLILDMENMAFMDSSGIGVILGRYRQLQHRNGKVSVRKMNRQVEKVFRLSGMDQIIEML